MRRLPALLLCLSMLPGCMGGAGQLSADKSVVSAPSGAALPRPVRAMMVIPPRDLDRPLIIQATINRNETVSMSDGRTLEKAGRSVLSQIFAQLELNNPAIRPQVVIKVSGIPRYYRKDGFMKAGCGLDFFAADGSALGNFVARFETTEPVDYKDALEPAYAICLKRAADQALASSAVQKALAAPSDPHPMAYKAFMESLGLKP